MVIGENCWIATHVIFVRGVTVGEGAIIGMGAVVTKDVPPLAVVAGNPARIIKYRDREVYERLKAEGKIYLDMTYDYDRSTLKKSELSLPRAQAAGRRQRMSRPAVGSSPAVPLQIRTVTVLGASGTMSAAAAGLFAAYGEAQVYVTGRDSRRTAAAVGRAARSVRGDSIRTEMTPVAWEELERAVAVSDPVFESVAEDAAVKAAVLARAAAAMRPDALLCTGSSGLSVTALAGALPADTRRRFMGMHLFNPPGKMTLCELIPTPDTDPALADAVQDWLERTLRRQVVRTSDTPAFLANRIGLCFLHGAAHLAETCRDRGELITWIPCLAALPGVPCRRLPRWISSGWTSTPPSSATCGTTRTTVCTGCTACRPTWRHCLRAVRWGANPAADCSGSRSAPGGDCPGGLRHSVGCLPSGGALYCPVRAGDVRLPAHGRLCRGVPRPAV